MSTDYLLYTTIYDEEPMLFLRRNSDCLELMRCGKNHHDAEMLRRIEACWNACHGISTENLADNQPVKELADRYNATRSDLAAALAERDAALARVAELDAELKATKASAARLAIESFKGNIEAISKLDIDPMGCQPILNAVQDGDISTGRARELLRCWVLDTFTHDMLPASEGSGEYLRQLYDDNESPASVFDKLLSQLGKITDYARRLERIHVSDAEVIHNHVCAMRAFVIDADLNGANAAMKWIRNTLAGPGFLPDSDAALEAVNGDRARAAQVEFDREMAAERERRAGLPDPLSIAEPNAHTISQSLVALATAARDVGYEVRVFQVPMEPLAMGNHSTRVSVYRNHAGRKADEAAKAAQEAGKS